jgi:hypothetical protein
MTLNGCRLTQHTGNRPGTLSSPELYVLLIQQRGWTLSAYSDFLNAAMASQLHQSMAWRAAEQGAARVRDKTASAKDRHGET